METAITRAAQRLRIAKEILADLRIFERWQPFGEPVLVGAAAYDLVVAPDIDMEIYCPEPRVEDGFQVLQDCALNPRIIKARFSNELHGPDQGLYWQLRYRYTDEQVWKIDMWSMRYDHPGPTSASLVEPMKKALTTETRQAILGIKEQALLDPMFHSGSIHIYRAVLDDGIRNIEQFRTWQLKNNIEGLINWKPRNY